MIQSIYNRFRRITSNQLYFPEIDGIRFLAIVLVVLFHINGYFIEKTGITPVATLEQGISSIVSGGNRGVQLFFVLSGFILCLPFAHQYINNGKPVSLKRYYLRRVTRLEPPYFIAMIGLFVMMAIMQLHPITLLIKSLFASLAYCHNIIMEHAPYLTVVAWSLEIEIQFYVLAPLLFMILKLDKPVRRLILVVICLLFTFLQQYYPPNINTIYLHIQYFVSGILLADLYVSGELVSAKKSPLAIGAAIVLFAAVLFFPFKTEFWAKVFYPFIVCAFYLLILRAEVIKRIFSYGFLPIIGGMCYSIYLLHYPIISFIGRFTSKLSLGNSYLPNLVLQVIFMSSVILVVSAAFYALVERPFMSSKWTDKLMKKRKDKSDLVNNVIPEGATKRDG